MSQLQNRTEDEESTDWLTVPEGQFTFDVEGSDDPGSRYFSRVAHDSIGDSGITIGRGYDLYQQFLGHLRNADKVVEDLTAVGISQELIELLKPAITLQGDPARDFYRDNPALRSHVITRKQQHDLYNRIYSSYKSKAKSLYEGHIRQHKNTMPAFDELNVRIQEWLIDMGYRGDIKEISYKRDNYFNNRRPRLTDDQLTQVRRTVAAFRSAVVSNDVNVLAQYFVDHKEPWKNFWGFPPQRAAERIWFLRDGLPIPDNVVSLVFPQGY